MNIFLKAKHWQIFLLTYVMWGLMYLYVVIESMFVSDYEGMVLFFTLLPYIIVLQVAGLYLWSWAVAMNLQSVIPEQLRLRTWKFILAFFIRVILIVIIVGFIVAVMIEAIMIKDLFNYEFYTSIFVTYALYVLSDLYCIYFIAKTVKITELQREVSLSQILGEIFMIWLFLVGIWSLQPKINKAII